MNYHLKGVKTFNGMEGGGYEASIYLDKKKVGTAMNGGDGGTDNFRFINREEEAAFQAYTTDWYETSDAKIKWDDWCKENSVPINVEAHDKMESWVSESITTLDEDKWLKRNNKTKTMFRLIGDERGAWRTLGGKGDKYIRHIREKYGDKVETIYGLLPTPSRATTAPSAFDF